MRRPARRLTELNTCRGPTRSSSSTGGTTTVTIRRTDGGQRGPGDFDVEACDPTHYVAALERSARGEGRAGGFRPTYVRNHRIAIRYDAVIVLNDFRVAVRQHVRQPGFALTVVLTLALTVGATTAVFAVVNGVLVRALPFASPEQLVWIASVRPDNPSAPFTLPEFMDYRSQARSLTGLAAYANWSASLAGDGVTERLQGARMSANAFDVLGVAPAAGRLLDRKRQSRRCAARRGPESSTLAAAVWWRCRHRRQDGAHQCRVVRDRRRAPCRGFRCRSRTWM